MIERAEPVYVGLGANLGEREAALRGAVAAMGQLPGTQLLRVSGLYRSAPVGAGGPDYLNAVALLATTLAPQALLQALQSIEQAAGRERPFPNAPRTLDLDILRFGERTLHTPQLIIPHRRIAERAFVLCPLAELDPALVPPAALNAVAQQPIERIKGPEWTVGA